MKVAFQIVVILGLLVGCSQGFTYRPVVPEDLASLLREADRMVVTEGAYDGAKELFTSDKESDLVALSKAFQVEVPEEFAMCACYGSATIYLYKGNELLGHVSDQHGVRIRCSLWDSDVPVVNTEDWLTWFDKRKIKRPRQIFEQERAE